MRLLILAHSYVAPANREKLAAVARTPNCSALGLVAPDSWSSILYQSESSQWNDTHTYLSLLETFPKKTNSNSEASLLYPWKSLIQSIRKFKPDVILVEHGSYSLALYQAALIRLFFAPAAKLAYFFWWNLPLSSTKSFLERLIKPFVDGAIFGNQEALKLAQQRGFNAPHLVSPLLGENLNPRTQQEYQEARSKLAVRGFTVGCVGRMVKDKGFDQVAHALKALPSPKTLVLLGSGPETQELINIAQANGVEVVHREGIKNHEVRAHAIAFDAWVVPSRTTPTWVEQFGHVLIEAMAWGIPVIGSTSGPIPSVVGEAGMTFAEENINELSMKLSLLQSNLALREELTTKGLARSKAHFTHDAIASNWVQFLSDLRHN